MGLTSAQVSDHRLSTSERFRASALDAVAGAHAAGFDLDDVAGSELALGALANAAASLPLPGDGLTADRFAGLAAIACVDVTLGRLLEAHADAIAILAELEGVVPASTTGQVWGVWAAEGPRSTVVARPHGTSYRLAGSKPWCSGAGVCTHALVTARVADGRGLFAVALDADRVTPALATWQATGMTGSDTRAVDFHDVPAEQIGSGGRYLSRPGFWSGAMGVAAVWWGAATGIAAPLYESAATESLGIHGLAHLGAVDTDLATGAILLREAAARIDHDQGHPLEHLALTVRAGIESGADDVIRRVGRALGPTVLCHDRAHARRVADLTVYLRQSHAESDLERIGRLTVAAPDPLTGLDSW